MPCSSILLHTACSACTKSLEAMRGMPCLYVYYTVSLSKYPTLLLPTLGQRTLHAHAVDGRAIKSTTLWWVRSLSTLCEGTCACLRYRSPPSSGVSNSRSAFLFPRTVHTKPVPLVEWVPSHFGLSDISCVRMRNILSHCKNIPLYFYTHRAKWVFPVTIL